jgi:hypothetical protein
MPHDYDWRLDQDARDRIDRRYLGSWLGRRFHQPEWGMPSGMHEADHACLMAGFAQWCDRLIADGNEITAA